MLYQTQFINDNQGMITKLIHTRSFKSDKEYKSWRCMCEKIRDHMSIELRYYSPNKKTNKRA